MNKNVKLKAKVKFGKRLDTTQVIQLSGEHINNIINVKHQRFNNNTANFRSRQM